jgi:Uma2 family endonuclease
MASTLLPPENDYFPNRIRWTVEECYRLVEEGFLKGRYELIDGEIISKMGQKPPHRLALMLIANWLVSLFGDLCVQRQEPIRIPGEEGIYTEPEPDVAVTSQPTTAYVEHHPEPADLLLVVEVSDTTLRFDRNFKALLYARAGVREYWVMDITNRCLYIHLQPTPTGYAEIAVHVEEATVTLSGRPETAVPVSALLPPLESSSV